MAIARGTTTNSYHPDDRPIRWVLTNLRATLKTIIIINTGDTNSLDYKLITQVDEQGNAGGNEFNGILAAKESAILNIRYPRNVIEVDVKSNVADNHTGFEIQTAYEKLLEI